MQGWSKIIKNFFSLTTAEVINRLAALIYLPYIARIFGPDGFGKLNFAESIAGYFMLGANFGFDMIGIREIAKSGQGKKNAFANILIIEIAAALVSFFALCVFTYFINQPAQMKILIILYGLTIITFAFTIEWFFIGIERMNVVATVRVIKQLVYISFILLIIKSPQHLYRLPLSFVAANVLAVVILFAIFFLLKKRAAFEFDAKTAKLLFLESLPLGASRTLNVFRDRVGLVFLGFVRTAKEVGLYSVGYKFLTIANIIPQMLYKAIFPNMANFLPQGSPDEIRDYAKKVFRLTSVLAFPLSFFVYYNAGLLVTLIFGRDFKEGIVILQVIIWATMLLMFNRFYYYYLVSTGKQKKLSICSLLAIIINIILCFYFIPLWGPVGAAVAFLASEVIASIAYWLAAKLTVFPFTQFIKSFIYFLPSIILCAVLHGRINSLITTLFAASLYLLILVKATDLLAVIRDLKETP